MAAPQPIRRVTFRTDELRFPPRCLDCAGAPDGAGALTHKLGPLHLRLPAPFCKACASARLRRRILWYVATVGVMVAWLGVVMVVQEGGLVSKQSPVLPLLVVAFTAYALAWYVFETRLFHARYSRIWIATFENAVPKTVTLASRDEALLRAISEGGGVAAGDLPRA